MSNNIFGAASFSFFGNIICDKWRIENITHAPIKLLKFFKFYFNTVFQNPCRQDSNSKENQGEVLVLTNS